MTSRLALWVVALGLLLGACAPGASIENNVQPTLVSATSGGDVGSELVLEGRYFGDGRGGEGNSYVILGADINGENGGRIKADSWTPSKITLAIPAEAGYGFVFVVVDGVRSNGLPVNLP